MSFGLASVSVVKKSSVLPTLLPLLLVPADDARQPRLSRRLIPASLYTTSDTLVPFPTSDNPSPLPSHSCGEDFDRTHSAEPNIAVTAPAPYHRQQPKMDVDGMREQRAVESQSNAVMGDCNDYQQHGGQWGPDNANCCATNLDEVETTTSGSPAREDGHFHAPEPTPNEMVTGQLLSSRGSHHSVVQSEAGPSSHVNTLLPYTRDPRNLVIDSVNPDVPHIVITRPEPIWDEYYANSLNRVEYQWPGFIAVPEPQRGFVSAARHPLGWTEAPSTEVIVTAGPAVQIDRPTRPRRRRRMPPAFCKAQFNEMIDYAVWDRESYPNVCTSLLRRLYILSAVAAAEEASCWRTSYDEPDWICPANRPYRWDDPALALLPTLRSQRGTLILDSIVPLVAPHIVINEPPPVNPWIAFFNIPSDPQDAGLGNRLTVPWPRIINEPCYAVDEVFDAIPDEVEFYNVASDDDHSWTNEDVVDDCATYINLEATGDEGETSSIESDDSSSSLEDCDSRPDTPAPDTPLDSPVMLRFGAAKTPDGVNGHVSASEWLVVPTAARSGRPRQVSL